MRPWQFRVISVARAAFLRKIDTKCTIVDIDIEVGYVGMAATRRTILVVKDLVVLIGS